MFTKYIIGLCFMSLSAIRLKRKTILNINITNSAIIMIALINNAMMMAMLPALLNTANNTIPPNAANISSNSRVKKRFGS